MSDKSELMSIIKELIKVNKDETIFINENYLEYFSDEELINIINSLKEKKSLNSLEYLDELYDKTKEDN